MIIGGDSRLTLEDLGRVAGLYDVTSQPDYLQTMDAPCPDCVWMLVGSARGESLMVRR